MPKSRLISLATAAALTLALAAGAAPSVGITRSSGPSPDASATMVTQQRTYPPLAVAAQSTPPACALGDKPTKLNGRKGYDAVLDTTFRLPTGWKPPSLKKIGGGLQLQPAAADAWRTMRARALSDGIALYPISAYRSEDYQRGLFARNVRKNGRAHALKFVARPGHSEHQLGLTLDIGYAPGTAITAEWSSKPRNRNQKAASWLTSRGWRYGWVRSYPKGKVSTTCYESEPWHWRYIGPMKAEQVRRDGITLREFLWRLRTAG